MDYYSIWPAAVCFALVLALMATGPFAPADAPPSDVLHRISTLDGLRGVVALAVVLHHTAIFHRYLQDDWWNTPPSDFYAVLGQGGVGLFFMVTGYLFWTRVLRERGRFFWLGLAIGRFFRVGPVYVVAIIPMLLMVARATGWRLNVPASVYAQEVAAWLALGLHTSGSINGYLAPQFYLAGVTWTLRYEWIFYASLPMLALAIRRAWLALPITTVLFALAVAWSARGRPYWLLVVEPSIACLFGCGMLSAALHARGWTRSLSEPWASCAVAALLLAVIAIWPDAYQLPAMLLLGAAFHMIASGCSVFGLLTLRPTRRLGDISYPVYLLQGLVLTAVFRPAPLRAIALGSPLGHWMLTLAAMILLVCVATVVHAWVERPGIALGKRVAAWRWPKLDIPLARRL